MPYITQTAAGIRDQLTIFGKDYNTPDGTCIRDYIHVVDLAKAHVKALQFAQGMTSKTEVFNIGTGNGSSVNEVVSTFEKVNQVDLPKVYGDRRAGDVEQIWADTTKAQQVLGWNAKLDLARMMEDAWRWQQSLD